jgi:hypothetical protein
MQGINAEPLTASRKDYKKTGLKNGLFQALAKY